MVATPVGDYRIRFKVHAEKNVTGDRAVLNSVLTYKLTDKSGEISNQRVDLGIQFALINEHAKTSKTEWPTQGTIKAQEVRYGAASPIVSYLVHRQFHCLCGYLRRRRLSLLTTVLVPSS